jgi:signal transduction histidine kinase
MTTLVPRLLLVEDEDAHAELIRRAFADEGVESVEVATSLAQARELLAAGAASDLVITDLRLPDGLGMELLEVCAERIPVVIMTSQGDERDAVEAIKRGAYDYVVKSVVAFETMPRTAERVLREWRHAQDKADLQRALAERERLASIGQTAAMLAHEIGNPLNTMILTARVVERRLNKLVGVDVSGIVKLVETCQREIERLSELLAEFRELSRQRDLRLEPLCLVELVESVVDLQRRELEAGQVDVHVELARELIVLANAEKMTQVLINLCKNSIEAMPSGGRIEIGALVGAEVVTLTVTDNGPGLAEGLEPFTPFATTKERGTGLGLAVVAQILASHGGRAYHERPDHGGARFCLQLRRALS